MRTEGWKSLDHSLGRMLIQQRPTEEEVSMPVKKKAPKRVTKSKSKLKSNMKKKAGKKKKK